MGTRARAVVLCLATLGLASVLTASGERTAASVVARYAAFAVAVVLLARILVVPGAHERRKRRLPRSFALTGSLVGSGLVVMVLPKLPFLSGLAVFAAAVEELVFRRELPRALATLFARPGVRNSGAVSGILVSQVLFAVCHFLDPESPRLLSSGMPFVRLAIAGTCLAVLYRVSGGLLVPTAFHWLTNEIRQAAVLGSYLAMSARSVVSCALLAASALIAFERTTGRLRPLARSHPDAGHEPRRPG